jgi:two-component system, cell cycle sensor histidine kinase and response regulator CckA
MSIGTQTAIPSERAASKPWPAWLAYVFAVALPVGTLLARMGIGVAFADRPMLILFQLPIIISAYMGGLGPGLVATAAAAVLVDFFLIPPIHTFHFAFTYIHDLEQWGIFIVNGVLISVLSETLHRSWRQAEMSRAQHEKSEERFRRAMEATSDGLWDWDVASGSVYYSPGYFRMLGREPEESPAKADGWLEMVHPDDRKRALAANEACIRNDVPALGVEFRMLSHDGTWRWILRRGKAIAQDADGRALRIIGTHIDITDRKHAEESLRRSQRQLADIIEFIPDATFVINNEGTVIAWNRAMESMTGISKSKMIGKGDFEYSLPFYGSRRPALIDLLSASEEKKIEYYDSVSTVGGAIVAESYTPDAYGGKGAYLWGVATALFDEEGNVAGAIESIRDITARKLAEKALHESEERFSRFFRASPVPSSISRWSDSQFADVNDAFLGLCGYTREELIGHTSLELGLWVNPEHRAKMVEMLKDHGKIRDIETQFVRKSGDIIDVLCFAEIIDIAGGKYILSLGYDITERKRGEEERKKLEEQLFQSQKMESVGRLAGGVAHDFNNMLGVIIGRAEIALEQDVSTGIKHHLNEILKASQRSADLTRQLLAFARKQTAAPKILDLNDTISGMLKMLRRLIGEDIDLSWQPGLDLWKVKIDPSQVDQILANLVVNARDAISGTGAVTMRTENVVIDDSNRAEIPEFIPGEYVLLTVSDTGAGMSREVRENIFEPFFTTKEVGKGTGLGLSTVYGIIKQNDGFIYVASEPGKGTTFRIYLPRFDAETAQVPSEQITGKRPTGTETVLLVEDDETVLDLSKVILENLGYTVLAASTPRYAIHLVEDHPGDLHLLITDVVMPEMNGRELAEQLRVIHPNLKCLYMSGYPADVIAHRGILDEGVDFIQKPFGSDDLAAKVRQMLDHLE